MARPSSDVAFTPAVKAAQTQRGSRASYARVERSGGFATEVDDDLAAFLAERDSFYLATASAEGQPYVQHRGGPKGFVHVLDAHTLAFADFAGNRQFVSLGNLSENPRAFLFFMDHARRQRIKVWGRARVVEDDPALLAQLTPAGYVARPERVIVFTVEAWDANCPQHIPQLLPAKEVQAALERKDARIRELEAALARQGA
ncbi:MAG: pyridoxamine 5'-phosphate oxidase family protein [Myxococcales bacterium]|nr:pyridoxamine 5'-phosphate oxidase family protein [Myxococcales bacterium]